MADDVELAGEFWFARAFVTDVGSVTFWSWLTRNGTFRGTQFWALACG